MNRRSIFSDDGAVSETLGYIMIFGIITACIALVFITGSRIISETQDRASFQGMEQSFEVISSDVSRTALEASPAMSTRVKIGSGSLAMLPAGNSGSILDINYDNGNFHRSYSLGTLVFQSNVYGQSINLEDGALVKMYGGDGRFGTIMTLHPKIYFSPSYRTLYLAVMNLTGDYTGISGGYITNIKSSFDDSGFYSTNNITTNNTLVLSMRTNYTGAWYDYWGDYFTSTYGSALGVVTDETAWGAESDKWATVKLTGVNEVVIVTYNVSIKM